jgi:hypothetical protein
MMPISAFEPPRLVIKRGKRKKAPILDTMNKAAAAIKINDRLYRTGSVLERIKIP